MKRKGKEKIRKPKVNLKFSWKEQPSKNLGKLEVPALDNLFTYIFPNELPR